MNGIACALCRHAGGRHLATSCTETTGNGKRCSCPGFQAARPVKPRGLAIALLLALAGACAHHLVALPGELAGPNMPAWAYCAHSDQAGKCDVYRSAQPTRRQLEAMRDDPDIRLASDLKLNPAAEAREDVPAGIVLIEHPISSVFEPSEAEVDSICADLEAAPKPVLVHCTEGRERTGWAIERCIRMHQRPTRPSADAMYAEWLAYGMRPWLAEGLIKDFDRATGFARAGAKK